MLDAYKIQDSYKKTFPRKSVTAAYLQPFSVSVTAWHQKKELVDICCLSLLPVLEILTSRCFVLYGKLIGACANKIRNWDICIYHVYRDMNNQVSVCTCDHYNLKWSKPGWGTPKGCSSQAFICNMKWKATFLLAHWLVNTRFSHFTVRQAKNMEAQVKERTERSFKERSSGWKYC